MLAAPWSPRGELPRLLRYHDRLRAIYDEVVIGLLSLDRERKPDELAAVTAALDDLGIAYAYFGAWSGRHTVLRLAVERDADAIHYVDMDRLVRWVETRPEELSATARRATTTDNLLIGRTPAAYATHSRTLIDTEALTNRTFSHWLRTARPGFAPGYADLDFSAGSRGFSRRAAQFILAHSPDENALAMDLGWLALLVRGGFALDYVEVDGLDWETADRYRDSAADASAQRALAEQVDADPEEWARRARVAREMLDYGLAALDQPLSDAASHEG
jgi:hypothetical protein